MINRIKKLCKEKKITIAELERKFDMANGQISKWNKTEPRARHIQNIANYFNVTMEYILDGTGTETEETEELLRYYKTAGKEGKKNIMRIARMEYEDSNKINNRRKNFKLIK